MSASRWTPARHADCARSGGRCAGRDRRPAHGVHCTSRRESWRTIPDGLRSEARCHVDGAVVDAMRTNVSSVAGMPRRDLAEEPPRAPPTPRRVVEAAVDHGGGTARTASPPLPAGSARRRRCADGRTGEGGQNQRRGARGIGRGYRPAPGPWRVDAAAASGANGHRRSASPRRRTPRSPGPASQAERDQSVPTSRTGRSSRRAPRGSAPVEPDAERLGHVGECRRSSVSATTWR